MESLLDLAEPYFAQWGYLIVFLATFLESAAFVGAVVPGEATLLVAGMYVEREALNMPHVAGASFAGAILGDTAGYLLGRFGGRWAAERFGRWLFLPRDRLARVERYFARHGTGTVFLGRFAPALRTIRTFVAGVSKMPYPKFMAADAVGAAIWSVVIPAVGYLFAGSLHLAQRSLGVGGAVLFVVLVAAFFFSYRAMIRRVETEEGARAPEEGP